MADDIEKLNPEQLQRLGQTLKTRFAKYEKDRRDNEVQWLKNLRQFLGEYDPEILSKLSPEQSRAYPKVTRVKVVSAKARLMSLLFPAGEKNWALAPSPVPSLGPDVLLRALNEWRAANPDAPADQETMDRLVQETAQELMRRHERVIDDELKDVGVYGAKDYEDLVREVMMSAILYGPGVVKGPMTVEHQSTRIVVENGVPQVQVVEAYRPAFEFVSVWDYYPDLSARDFAQMDGQFQRHVYSRHTVTLLAERPDFMGDVISGYLREHTSGNYVKRTFETELDGLNASQKKSTPDGQSEKFELLEFWGVISGQDLRAAGIEVSDAELDNDHRACVWLLDGKVIKVARDPLPEGACMYHQYIYEEDEVNLLGRGLPQIVRDSQLGVATSTRMLVDNAAAVCGPMVEVDLSQITAASAATGIRPFKTWFLDQPSPSGRRAVQSVSVDSHIPALQSMVQMFNGFADSESFVGGLTGGDFDGVSGEALRTTGGASMAYANAALPFRDTVRNFDRFTVSVIYSLAQWNMIFHEDREQLSGDIRPIATGSTSLMAKEMRAFALDSLANTLTDDERMYLNSEELLKQRLAVRDLNASTLLATKSEVERRMAAQAQQAQVAQQREQALFESNLRNLNSDTLKQTAQAQKHLDSADVAVFKALIEAVKAGGNLEDVIQQIRQDRTAALDAGSGRSAPGAMEQLPAAAQE